MAAQSNPLRGSFMKKILLLICSLLFLSAPSLLAQGKTGVAVLGKNKGTVSSLQANGKVLVDARATAKKLGGSVELFSAAKQIKIAFPKLYAILSAPLDEAIINGNTVKLTTEVVASGGKIYVPVSFFTLPQIEKALDRQVTFEDNTIIVEKNYNLAYVKKEQKADYTRLTFSRKGHVSFSSEEPNKHTVKVLFPSAVLKRNVTQRSKDNFVRSFSLTQKGKDVELKIILAKRGKVWTLQEEKGMLVLSVSEKTLPSVAKEMPKMSATEEAEELVLTPEKLVPSVIAETNADTQEPAVKPTPVLKPAPPPVMVDASPVLKDLADSGAAAVGFNCVAADMMTPYLVRKLAKDIRIPILCKPNAGNPIINAAGVPEYDMDTDEFAKILLDCHRSGAKLLGGCCGTTPDHIAAMTELLK